MVDLHMLTKALHDHCPNVTRWNLNWNVVGVSILNRCEESMNMIISFVNQQAILIIWLNLNISLCDPLQCSFYCQSVLIQIRISYSKAFINNNVFISAFFELFREDLRLKFRSWLIDYTINLLNYNFTIYLARDWVSNILWHLFLNV